KGTFLTASNSQFSGNCCARRDRLSWGKKIFQVARGAGAMTTQTEQATLGGGCFCRLETEFEKMEGVEHLVSGYTGGSMADPNYRQVCTGATGHAEVVQVTFDPAKISFREILELFFAFHDPTTRDRQGGDIGTQYRSAIFYHSPEQKEQAQQVIKTL